MPKGTIVVAQLDKGRGPCGYSFISKTALKVGDPIVAGTASGRVRAMIDHNGKRVRSAGPSVPVEVLGFSEVPEAGDILYAVGDDKLARQVAEERKRKIRDTSIRSTARASLDDLSARLNRG